MWEEVSVCPGTKNQDRPGDEEVEEAGENWAGGGGGGHLPGHGVRMS